VTSVFAFGKNWKAYARSIDEERIAVASAALSKMLGRARLDGLSFVDVGCGSGLMSLAARRLGARVVSFDVDRDSVECSRDLQARFHAGDPDWKILEGSALDVPFLAGLGTFDIVYSWGVLHHTGAMWRAIGNAHGLAKPDALFFIAIYNDQGRASRRWLAVKKLYNALPAALRWLILLPALARLWGPTILRDALTGAPLRSWRDYRGLRGMSAWHDVVDWVGGYPFEVAKPEEIFGWFRERGWSLAEITTCGGGLGCNEFVFGRGAAVASKPALGGPPRG
jgi:SAM-dependent methyltransferase